MEDNEDGGASLFLNQMVDFTTAPPQPIKVGLGILLL